MRAQQCDIFLGLYTRYLVGLAVAAWLAVSGYYLAAVLFAVAWFAVRVIYARWVFPFLAPVLGHPLTDQRPDTTPATAPAGPVAPVTVTLYSAIGCPCCPIVERRLKDLQAPMGFVLHHEDVTLRPQVLTSKGCRAVPVTEIGERRLVGNATSAQLAAFIRAPVAA